MAEFQIKATTKGDKEVVRALNSMPKVFFVVFREWLKNERAQFLGGKDAKGKIRRGGYRNLLMSKQLRNRSGTWSSRMAGLFKGVIPFANKINDLQLVMGALGRGHQLTRALELLHTGGTINSSKEMPIPVYKNLASKGYNGPWSSGGARDGMKSVAFARFASQKKLTRIQKGGKAYYFDKKGRNVDGTFNRSDLLFIGTHSVRIKKVLTGRLDFFKRFKRSFPRMIIRGQKAVEKGAKRVEKLIG